MLLQPATSVNKNIQENDRPSKGQVVVPKHTQFRYTKPALLPINTENISYSCKDKYKDKCEFDKNKQLI